MRIGIAVCCFLLLGLPARAERADVFEAFTGVWVSDGDAFGGPAQSKMIWETTLDGKFVKLSYRIDMPRDESAATFEGVAYYRASDENEWNAFWADNSGALYSIRAEIDEKGVLSHWGVEGGKQGRTRYTLTADGDIEVTDWVHTPDGWRQFNNNTFSRAPR
ncbi:hypothetical protein [Hyphococcus sp.]|uniref:hypothetical protein n=1 Tax=Hyphococcus sp. TaxID=2038636 RepID=UPI003CCBC231